MEVEVHVVQRLGDGPRLALVGAVSPGDAHRLVVGEEPENGGLHGEGRDKVVLRVAAVGVGVVGDKVHHAVAAQGVPLGRGVNDVVDFEAVLPAVFQVQAGVGEGEHHGPVLTPLNGGLGVVQHVLGGEAGGVGVVGGVALLGRGIAGAGHDLIEGDGGLQNRGELVAGALALGLAGGALEIVPHLQEAPAAAPAVVLHVLREGEDNVRIGGGVLGGAHGGLGEGLADDGSCAVGGVNGDLLHAAGGVVLIRARVVLGDVVEVVGLLGQHTGDVDGAVLVHHSPDRAGQAVGALVHAGGHLQNGVETVQRRGLLIGARLRPGVGGPRRDGHPVHRTVLIQPEGEVHAGGAGGGGGGLHDELRRGLVGGGEGEGDNGGAVGPVGVRQPEVDRVGGLLLQPPVVDAEGVLDVLLQGAHAVAQRAGDGGGLQLIDRGRLGILGHKGVVEHAVLVGGYHGHAVLGGGGGHVGIARVEGGHGVVRGGEGDHLGGAALAPVVHHHGGEIVGPVGGEAGEGGSDLGVPLGGDDGAGLYGDGAVGRGLDEIVLAHGAVGDGADRPVDGAPLIGCKGGGGGVGGDVGDRGVAGEDHGLTGGFLGGGGVHDLAVDDGGDAGTDVDLVRQHGHGGAGGVDVELLDVALAGHGGARVQIQLLDLRAPVNDDGGLRRGLVHGQLGHGALGGPDLGAGGPVDYLLDAAGQIQLHGHVVLGPLLALRGRGVALQGDVLQSHAVGGVVLDVGAGAHSGAADLGDAVGLEGDIVVLEVIHQQLVGHHVAQGDAGPAALALAGAAGDDAAQDGDVLQLHVAQAHAAGDVQIPADDAVAEGHAGGGDGHVAEHAAQGVVPGLLEGGAHDAGEHGGHLAPGEVLLGPEGPVVIAGDQVVLQGGLDGAPGPGADVPGVGKAQDLPGGLLEHHVAPQDGGRRLPGEGVLGGDGGGGGALDVLGGIGDAHVVVVPVVLLHIGEGGLAGHVVAVGPVDDGHEVRPGQLLGGGAGLIGADKAPLHQLVEVGVRPVGLGLLSRDRRRQPQQNRHGQQEAHRPGTPAGAVCLVHSLISFLHGKHAECAL